MSLGLKRVSGAGSIRIKEIEMTERQKTKEFDFNGFFNSSLDRLTEIMSELKETAQSEDIESLKGKVKNPERAVGCVRKDRPEQAFTGRTEGMQAFRQGFRQAVGSVQSYTGYCGKGKRFILRRVEDDVRAGQRSFPYGPRFKSCEKACGV